jgi:hypothetical protein
LRVEKGEMVRNEAEAPDLPRTKLAFTDHPLVSVHLVFDAIPRAIALPEEQTNDFIAAFGGVVDAPIGEKLHRLANAVFVLRHADPSGMGCDATEPIRPMPS